jgi:hypothetical protein
MKRQIPTIVLAILCMAMAFSLYTAKKENALLRQALEGLAIATPDEPMEEAVIEQIVEAAAVPTTVAVQPPEVVAAETAATNSPSRRMMSSMAKMMENPTMNKVMEASQRGAVGALYSDLIEYLNLNTDETKYFMDLLMYRQMKQMDLGMKMMGGGLDEEEKQALTAELKEASEKVKTEMETFLNNPADFEEFEFYEKTMGERMMLSQMDQQLSGSDAALPDTTYRELLGMMHEEKENFDFSSDLHDEENMDLSPARFSKQNITSFAADMDRLNAGIIQRAQGMLTPAQLAAFEGAIKTTADMQKAQLEMAGQMFGAKE